MISLTVGTFIPLLTVSKRWLAKLVPLARQAVTPDFLGRIRSSLKDKQNGRHCKGIAKTLLPAKKKIGTYIAGKCTIGIGIL